MRPRLLVVLGTMGAMALALAARGVTNVWLTTGAVSLVALLGCRWVDGPRLRGLLRPRRDTLGLGISVGLVSVLLTWLAHELAVDALPGLEAQTARHYAELQDWPGPVLALPVLALVVLAEECVWRGLLVDRLGDSVRALGLAALAYSVPQLFSGSPWLWAAALSCGLLWTGLRLYSGELVAPLAAHAVWDAFVFSGGLLG